MSWMRGNRDEEYNEEIADEIDRLRARHRNRRQVSVENKPGSEESDFEIEDLDAEIENNEIPPKRKHHILRWVILLLIVAALSFVALIFFQRQRNGYWTIAVFGVDSRNGNLGRGSLSDVEILCSVNRKTGEIRLASVFRDSYLLIDSSDGGSYDKINEAYFLGGVDQAVQALNDNFDLDIDDYAVFNWKAVADGINALGGIDLEITDKEFAYINSFITETVESTGVASTHLTQSGQNHLDGVQAVAYARLRLMDTDFNRTERQRKVIGLAMEKARQADIPALTGLIAAVFPQIKTTIGVDDLIAMAQKASDYYIGQTSGFPFSHTEMYIDEKSCVVPTTLESNVIQLHSFLYDNDQYEASAMVQQISAHIAEKSGVGEPGKDTETGKNIGAVGNTGEQQSTTAAANESSIISQAEEAVETELDAETQLDAATGLDTETETITGQDEETEERSDMENIDENSDTDENEIDNDNPETMVNPEHAEDVDESGRIVVAAPPTESRETIENNNNNGPVTNKTTADETMSATNGVLEAPGTNTTETNTVAGPGAQP